MTYTLKQIFYKALIKNDLDHVIECVEEPEFEYSWITENRSFENGLRVAIVCGYVEIVEYLLQFVDTLDSVYLRTTTNKNYLVILQLLLNHGKFDTQITLNTIQIQYLTKDVREKAKTLITEYLYRVDGTIYNQNIID